MKDIVVLDKATKLLSEAIKSGDMEHVEAAQELLLDSLHHSLDQHSVRGKA